MRTAQMDKPVTVKNDTDGPVISHIFYTDMSRPLRRGDRALCGFVHATDHPGHRALPANRQKCVVCWDLDR